MEKSATLSNIKFPTFTKFGNFDTFDLIARRFAAGFLDWKLANFFAVLPYVLFHRFMPDSFFFEGIEKELYYAAYFIIFFISPMQATPAMRLFKLKLFSDYQQRVPLSDATKFYLIYSIFFLWRTRYMFFVELMGSEFQQTASIESLAAFIRIYIYNYGKYITFFIIFWRIFKTQGRKSLANMYSNTYIDVTQKTRFS
jgi:uncharacterized RDD family membrane protein YckC